MSHMKDCLSSCKEDPNKIVLESYNITALRQRASLVLCVYNGARSCMEVWLVGAKEGVFLSHRAPLCCRDPSVNVRVTSALRLTPVTTG